jgi:hypothetical protein
MNEQSTNARILSWNINGGIYHRIPVIEECQHRDILCIRWRVIVPACSTLQTIINFIFTSQVSTTREALAFHQLQNKIPIFLLKKSRNTILRLYNLRLHSDDVKIKTRNSNYGETWFLVVTNNWLSIVLVLFLWKRSGGLVGSTTNILGQSNLSKFRENVSTHPRVIVIWISRLRIDATIHSHITRPAI